MECRPTFAPFRFSFAGAFVTAVMFVFVQMGEKPVLVSNPIWWPYAAAFVIGLLTAQAIVPTLKNEQMEHPGAARRFFHSSWWGLLLGFLLGLGLTAVGIGFDSWNFPVYIMSYAVGAAIRYAFALIFERPGPQPTVDRS